MDQLVQSIIDSLKNAVPAELIIFLISLLPILELRGGILAGTLLGVDWPIAYLICVIGNLLPIPFYFTVYPKNLRLDAKHPICKAGGQAGS